MIHKMKIDKLELIDINNFWSWKDTVMQMKKQAIDL